VSGSSSRTTSGWSLEEVLPLGLPVVFDAFHHELKPSLPELDVRGAVLLAGQTWNSRQEVHFSTQDPAKRPGAHSQTLDAEAFAAFATAVGDLDVDCIVEVKDKERSALLARELLDRTGS
jgi:UV DNA damage endonuclease